MPNVAESAAAFDEVIGNKGSESSGGGVKDSAGLEMMFGGMGELEVDEDSPPQGGGDDLPVKTAKAAKAPKEDDDGEEEGGFYDGEFDPEKDEAPDGEESGDDDGEEGGDDEDPIYEVTIDGEKAEVPLTEALNGYIRQETFHKRLNQLEDVKKVLRVEAQKVTEAQTRYTKLIDELNEHVSALVPKEPDWDAEFKANPEAARALQKRYEQLKSIRSELAEKREKTLKEQQDAAERETKEWIDGENAKVMANNPRWRDERVMQADLASMMQTALSAGFEQQEVLTTHDSRMIAILLKAAKFDRIMGRAPKPPKTKGNERPSKSRNSVPNRSGNKGNGKAFTRLQKTGSVEAAGEFFTSLIRR